MKKLKIQLGIFIAAFSFLLYAQSIYFNYALDDASVIRDNNLVHKGFAAIPTLLKTDRLFGLNDESQRMPEYRPVPMVAFALLWQFFPNSPHIYHLFIVLLYSLLCWLLFILLCNIFVYDTTMVFDIKAHDPSINPNEIKKSVRYIIIPFIGTILFAAHPIHTEVVNNIKSLDEVLCFLFAIVSITWFIKFKEKKTVFNLIVALICYFLSLLSKETGIAFLILAPLTLLVFFKIDIKEVLIVSVVLAAITGIFLLIRHNVLESIPKDRIELLNSDPLRNSLLSSSDLISQKATAFYILLRYIFLLIFPYLLSYDYSIAQVPVQQIWSPLAIIGIMLYLAISLYAFVKLRKKDCIAFWILFYLITLAPVSNIFMLINCTMAERFLFIPSLGFCILLSFLLLKIVTKGWKSEILNLQLLPSKLEFTPLKYFIKYNKILLILTFIITIFYSIRTIVRSPDWNDNVALISHDISIVPHSAKAHYNYSLELLFHLYPREKSKGWQIILLEKAQKECKKAIAIFSFSEEYYLLGAIYLEMGDYANSIINYQAAIRLDYPKVHPRVYSGLGLAYTRDGQFDKALSVLDSAIKYNPNYVDAYIKKSYTYLSADKNIEAINECDRFLKLDPNNALGYLNKGCAYLNLKQFANAIQYLNKGLELDSMNTACLHYLGVTYKNIGDTITADKYFSMESRIVIQ